MDWSRKGGDLGDPLTPPFTSLSVVPRVILPYPIDDHSNPPLGDTTEGRSIDNVHNLDNLDIAIERALTTLAGSREVARDP